MNYKKSAAAFVFTIMVSGGFQEAIAAQGTALSQIVEGAKKEAVVSVKLKSGLTPASMKRLEKEIKDKFHVDLRINYAPTDSMPKDLAAAVMENKVGAVPSYDLMTFGPEHLMTGLEEGIVEKVDWKSLLRKEVARDVLINLPPYEDVGLSCYTSQQGLIYNTKKVSPKEVPKTMKELADAKWKGRVGVFDYTASWAVRAHLLGKDNIYSSLRDILKNGAIQGRYTDLYSRFLLEEIWIAGVGNSYYMEAQKKGMPTGWQNLDFVDEESRPLNLRSGTRR